MYCCSFCYSYTLFTLFPNGFAVDPAAVTYLKQIKAYEEWALRQQENNKKIIG